MSLFALQFLALGQGSSEVLLEMSSGDRENTGNAAAILWSDVVTVPNATAMQLKFSQANLPTGDDWIIVTSLLDGEQMVIDSKSLKNFQNHTVWFNGPAVSVSLVVAPGSTAAMSVDRAFTEAPPMLPETICGATDNRVVTTDDRTCRVVPSGNSNCSWPGPCAASAWRIANSEAIATAPFLDAEPRQAPGDAEATRDALIEQERRCLP